MKVLVSIIAVPVSTVKTGAWSGGEVLPDFLLELDGAVLLWIQEYLRGPLTDAFFIFYTMLGNLGLVWLVLSVVMLFFKRSRRAGITALLALAVGFACTNIILKPLVHRTRPWLVVEGLTALVAEHDPHSFPSGHTAAAFAAACAWRPYLPKRWGNTALVFAALMGFSRLYVGVHFPTDVLCGAMIGVLSGWLASRLVINKEER